MNRLQSKIALITGANKGIGLSIVEKFLVEGAIVYAGIRDLLLVSTELQDLKVKFPKNLEIVRLDVTDALSCKEIIVRIKKEHNRLDVLVNNAGLITYELVPFIDFYVFEKMLQTNVIYLFFNSIILCN